jgi:hypothetical protein
MSTTVESKMTINVMLKTKEYFENKQLPYSPIEQGVVSFYINETTLRGYPLNDVEYFEFNNVKESGE